MVKYTYETEELHEYISCMNENKHWCIPWIFVVFGMTDESKLLLQLH